MQINNCFEVCLINFRLLTGLVFILRQRKYSHQQNMSPCRGKKQFLPCLLDWSDTWFAFYSQPLLLSCSFFWNMVLCCLLSIYILVASCYIISGALSHYSWHWHGLSIAHSGHSIFYVSLSAFQRLFSSIYIFMGNHWMQYLVCRYGRDP